jgi:hypothetical protein
MNKIIIVFHSTHDAINAERMCLRSGLRCQAIPVPREITAECGIALEVNPEDKIAVQSLFEKENISAIFHDR